MTGNEEAQPSDEAKRPADGEAPAVDPFADAEPPAGAAHDYTVASPGPQPPAAEVPGAPTVEAPAVEPAQPTVAQAPTVEQPPRDAGPSGTAVLPPVPEGPPARPRWAGRAPVPTPPRVEEYGEPRYEQPRSIAIPVLITVVVMLLLGVLGLGIWLIAINRPGSPTPTPPPGTTSSPTAPTTGPTSATPTGVRVPSVLNEDYDGAAAILQGLGLVPARLDEFNDAEAGTVLRTSPPEGTIVAPGATVTIVVSLGPEPPPSTPPPTTPAATATATPT